MSPVRQRRAADSPSTPATLVLGSSAIAADGVAGLLFAKRGTRLSGGKALGDRRASRTVTNKPGAGDSAGAPQYRPAP